MPQVCFGIGLYYDYVLKLVYYTDVTKEAELWVIFLVELKWSGSGSATKKTQQNQKKKW